MGFQGSWASDNPGTAAGGATRGAPRTDGAEGSYTPSNRLARRGDQQETPPAPSWRPAPRNPTTGVKVVQFASRGFAPADTGPCLGIRPSGPGARCYVLAPQAHPAWLHLPARPCGASGSSAPPANPACQEARGKPRPPQTPGRHRQSERPHNYPGRLLAPPLYCRGEPSYHVKVVSQQEGKKTCHLAKPNLTQLNPIQPNLINFIYFLILPSFSFYYQLCFHDIIKTLVRSGKILLLIFVVNNIILIVSKNFIYKSYTVFQEDFDDLRASHI